MAKNILIFLFLFWTTSVCAQDKEVFLYGKDIPTLNCVPLKISQILLEKGERIVDQPQVGDSLRWVITPVISSSEESQQITIAVKPFEAGLETNLIIPTDRRIYTINLKSSEEEWLPVLEFEYKDDKQWKDLITKIPAKEEQRNVNASNFDFNYAIRGDEKLKPIQVYNDGQQTFIKMPANIKEMPLFLSNISNIANYRIKNNCFIVDKIFRKAILVDGKGSNRKTVIIEYRGER